MTDSEQRALGIPENPEDWKIFPRNLTARAAYIVPGNPPTTRPETGVDNSFPGLEFDVRNLAKFFFPGTYFEVYSDSGARLRALRPESQAARWRALGLTDADVERGLYIWAMKGVTAPGQDPDDPPAIDFHDTTGLQVWAKAVALYPDTRVGLVIGPAPGAATTPPEDAMACLDAVWKQGGDGEIARDGDGDGALRWAVLAGPRARYLNEQGVIDPDVYQPGELIQTLCTPWMYDFRDCQCFYWASNKPDVVTSEDGKYEYLNFQRKNWLVEPQTTDVAGDYSARRLREIDYAEMMVDWQQLRPVSNGRERGQDYVPPPGPTDVTPGTLDWVRTELEYLATVEHALAVQYLYAYYSVATTRDRPSDGFNAARIWQAATEVFHIAISEMRHFRWANEVLVLLGGEPTIGRASMLGRRFRVPFSLQGLSSAQLQWFVDVERPSRSTAEGLDGMYTGILDALRADETLDADDRRRSVEIVKLIIDEGESHYERFSTAQRMLAGLSQGAWLRSDYGRTTAIRGVTGGDSVPGVPVAERAGTDRAAMQALADEQYRTILELLGVAFQDTSAEGGEALRQAISLMWSLDDTVRRLADRGITPLFALPEGLATTPPPARTQADRAQALARIRAEAEERLDAIEQAAPAPMVTTLASAFRADLERVVRAMAQDALSSSV